MTDAPPTPALALVLKALKYAFERGRYSRNGINTRVQAEELLQSLSALAPPDAIRAEPVRVDDVEVTLLLERLACVPGRLCRDAAAMIERLHTTPPSGAALRGEVVAHRWHWAGTHSEWQDGPGDPRVIAEIGAREGYRLEKAYAAPSPAQGWRPIESAPKGPRAILVYVPSNLCTYCVSWSDGFPGDPQNPKGWRIFGGGYRAQIQDPSHWAEIPPPPAGESNNG